MRLFLGLSPLTQPQAPAPQLAPAPAPQPAPAPARGPGRLPANALHTACEKGAADLVQDLLTKMGLDADLALDVGGVHGLL